jgi:hypothetical protein
MVFLGIRSQNDFEMTRLGVAVNITFSSSEAGQVGPGSVQAAMQQRNLIHSYPSSLDVLDVACLTPRVASGPCSNPPTPHPNPNPNPNP